MACSRSGAFVQIDGLAGPAAHMVDVVAIDGGAFPSTAADGG
jgi:hypothetical protein